MSARMTRTALPRTFGVFSPTGHVVLAFAAGADATMAREALLTGGYDEDEVLQFRSDDVIADVEQTREQLGLLGRLGMEWPEVERYFVLAQHGAAFQ